MRTGGPSGTEPVSFELERFELDGQRLELTGRWYGVRGRRFVRPSLTVAREGGTARSLAVLEHKPWAASEGEAWTAVFPVEALGELREPELAVAPDIAVALPALEPAPTRGRAKRSRAAPKTAASAKLDAGRKPRRSRKPTAAAKAKVEKTRRDAAPKRPTETTAVAAQSAPPARAATEGFELALLRDERDALRRWLEFEQGEALRLRTELDRARAAGKQADAAQQQHEAALLRLDAVSAERDAARAEVAEGLRERDRLHAECRRLEGEVQHERERVMAERDGAAAARDTALAERNAAIAERDTALAERDAAIAERDAAIAQRDLVRRAPRVAGLLGRARRRDSRSIWVGRAKVLVPLATFLLVVAELVRST